MMGDRDGYDVPDMSIDHCRMCNRKARKSPDSTHHVAWTLDRSTWRMTTPLVVCKPLVSMCWDSYRKWVAEEGGTMVLDTPWPIDKAGAERILYTYEKEGSHEHRNRLMAMVEAGERDVDDRVVHVIDPYRMLIEERAATEDPDDCDAMPSVELTFLLNSGPVRLLLTQQVIEMLRDHTDGWTTQREITLRADAAEGRARLRGC